MLGITIWGGKRSTADKAWAKVTGGGSVDDTVSAMSAIYSYLRWPLLGKEERNLWQGRLSQLSADMVENLDDSVTVHTQFTPDQVDVIATVCLYLHHAMRHWYYCWVDDEVLAVIRSLVEQKIGSLGIPRLNEPNKHTRLLLWLSLIRLINDPAERSRGMETLRIIMHESAPSIWHKCQQSRVYRGYGILCAEFGFRKEAVRSLLKAHVSVSWRVLDVQLKNLFAWGSLVGFRH